MPITRAQWLAIKRVIEDAHNALAVNFIDPKAVSPADLDRLKKLGLVDYRGEIVKDAYLLGRLLHAQKVAVPRDLTLPKMRRFIAEHPIPLSEAENRSIAMANVRTAQHVVGLGNRLSMRAGQIMVEADRKLRARTRAVIRDKVAQNIARRESVKRLRSDLYHETGDGTRDLDRIAVTEKQTAMQEGYAESIARRKGGETARVAKRVGPHCCAHCLRLYNGPDGAPRIFSLADLEANGTNVGRKVLEWLPVIGATHPNCTCTLIEVPKGFGFNEKGQMVFGGKLGTDAPEGLEASLRVETPKAPKRLSLRKAWPTPPATAAPRTSGRASPVCGHPPRVAVKAASRA